MLQHIYRWHPSLSHQSHLDGSFALIKILFEQPFTFQIWKRADARAKWENVWRKTREFQVVRNSCINQWHFPRARTLTWCRDIETWALANEHAATVFLGYRRVCTTQSPFISTSCIFCKSLRVCTVSSGHAFPPDITCSLACWPSTPSHNTAMQILFSTIWCFISNLLLFGLIPYLFNCSPQCSWIISFNDAVQFTAHFKH